MKSQNRLVLILWAIMSNDAVLAQYVTTVTLSINNNPFCTGIGDPGSAGNGSVSGVSGTGGGNSGFGSSNTSSSSTSSTINSSPLPTPTESTNGRYIALGYYPAPADGNLLGGPVSTSPGMILELCGTICQGYPYLALENGDECNCGSTLPSGTPLSAPPSKNKRRDTSGECTPCAGNGAECCGAPGYALVYRIVSGAESSIVGPHKTTTSSNSITAASSTSNITTSSVTTLSASTSDSSDAPFSIFSSASTSNSSNAPFSIFSSATSDSSNASSSIFSSATSDSSNASSSISSSTYVAVTPTSTFVSNTSYSAPYSNSTSFSLAVSSTSTIPTSGTTNGGSSGTNGTVASSTVANSGNYTAPGKMTATTKAGATTTVSSSTAESTVASPTPSCARSANYAGNNTKYIDYFGYTYDIRCNLNLQSTSADSDAYSDSFEGCLEYCSLLTGCVAITYQDPPSIPGNSSNCSPKWSFDGYVSSSVDGLYGAVNVNGASPGTIENQDLCTANNTQGASYNGSAYYDDYGSSWTIGCDSTLAVTSGAALSPTITDTLASCIDYCSIYDSCEMVNWTGPHTNGTTNDPNCFPASSNGTGSAASSAPGAGYATLYTF